MESVYRSTFATVLRVTGRVLAEPADRDAIVQQVYADLIGNRRLRASYEGGDLGSWLAGIARHRSLDFARRQRRLTDLGAVEEEGDDGAWLVEFRRDLHAFAGTLGETDGLILRSRFIEGMTQTEAAACVGIPRSTLEDREHAIKDLLREYLLAPPPGISS